MKSKTKTKPKPKPEDPSARARDQARAQYESIKEMVAALRKANDTGDDDAREDAEREIREDPLSIDVRGGWHAPGGDDEAEEYRILLSTGGPATQIVGRLDDFNQPETAVLQFQDWFTPWADWCPEPYDEAYRDTLVEYARQFYFGE